MEAKKYEYGLAQAFSKFSEAFIQVNSDKKQDDEMNLKAELEKKERDSITRLDAEESEAVKVLFDKNDEFSKNYKNVLRSRGFRDLLEQEEASVKKENIITYKIF